MDTRSNLIAQIYHQVNTYGEFLLWEVEISIQNESYHATKIFINEDNIAVVELENDIEIDIEELSYNELIEVYESVT